MHNASTLTGLHRASRLVFVLISGLVLAACGGGGGGSDSGSAPPAASSSSSAATSSSSIAASSSSSAVGWNVYDGTLHPSAAGSLTLSTGVAAKFTMMTGTFTVSSSSSSVAAGSSSSSSTSSASSSASSLFSFTDYFTAKGDGTVELNSSAVVENRSAAQYLNVIRNDGVYPKTFTLLARVLPVAGVTYSAATGTRLLDIAVGMSDTGVVGSVMEATIVADAKTVGLRINNTDTVADTDSMVALDLSVPHIYQIAITLTSKNAGTIKAYIDGATTPAIDVTTSNLFLVGAAGDNYLRIGDFRSSVFRSYTDWLLWTTTGAYTPADLKGKLPSTIGVTTGY
ncbi:MAG TPA: hypothetical protein VLC92_13655 [Rhodocyclaceae bacterium]|nr:hypothetical protein [Rhodocyclaceae bacterium]